jgi:hypothetical protein
MYYSVKLRGLPDIHYETVEKAWHSPYLGPRIYGVSLESFAEKLEPGEPVRYYAAIVQKHKGNADPAKTEKAYWEYRWGIENELHKAMKKRGIEGL